MYHTPNNGAAKTDDGISDVPSGDRIERAAEMLFQLGRSFARLPLPVPTAQDGGSPVSRTSVQVCLAIVGGQDADEDVTVGWVAVALGVEASTASRLVAQAIAAGFVQSSPAPTDRRRLVLDLTGAGLRLAHEARQYQRQVFDDLTASWALSERETFARLFIVFAGEVIRRASVERSMDR